VEGGHRLDLKRRRADKARRLAAGKIVLETHNGLFVALALDARIGPMPKNVSKHGANHRHRESPSTRWAIDRAALKIPPTREFLSQIDFWHGLLRDQGVPPVHHPHPPSHPRAARALRPGAARFDTEKRRNRECRSEKCR